MTGDEAKLYMLGNIATTPRITRNIKFVCIFCGKGGIMNTRCCYKMYMSQEFPYQFKRFVIIALWALSITMLLMTLRNNQRLITVYETNESERINRLCDPNTGCSRQFFCWDLYWSEDG